MVKTSLANAENMGSVLGWGAKILMAKKKKNINNRSDFVTNSIKI